MLEERCHLIGLGGVMGEESPVGLGAGWRNDE